MIVRELKVLLDKVPDDYEVYVQDINFFLKDSHFIPDEFDFESCDKTKRFGLPAFAQDYLEF